jgi:hypothetical protein
MCDVREKKARSPLTTIATVVGHESKKILAKIIRIS